MESINEIKFNFHNASHKLSPVAYKKLAGLFAKNQCQKCENNYDSQTHLIREINFTLSHSLSAVVSTFTSTVVSAAHLSGTVCNTLVNDQIMATIRDELHWLLVQQLDYILCNFIYKCLYQSIPWYMSSACIRFGEIEGRHHLRSAARDDLIVPLTTNKKKKYGPYSFSVSGPSAWNSLSLVARNLELILPVFHKLLKTEQYR